jgi:hypothetical protein
MSCCDLRFVRAIFVAACFFTLAAAVKPRDARAQDTQSQSVADAARRAKEAKDKAATKTKVITDDDLDAKRVKPGDQGLTTPTPQLETGPPPAADVAAAEAADKAAAKSPADAPVQKGDSPEVLRLKEQLARAEQDRDLAKREAALLQDSFYSNPDFAHDTAGKAKLDALQQQIADQQQKVDDLKARLASLKPSGSSTPSAPETPQAPAAPPES